jgi:hypothetical protein
MRNRRVKTDRRTKPSNPKQAFADRKLPIAITPATVALYDALGFLEGALKYGRANWRAAGVRVSTYVDACDRHVKKFVEGEWADPKTKVPHLVSARACLGIILDAAIASRFPVKVRPVNVGGLFLTDDRPPSLDIGAAEEEATAIANHLREYFKDHSPRHWTIDDTFTGALVPAGTKRKRKR